MTVVGDLTVLLDANTKGLRKGLSKARSALSGLNGALAGVVGVGGLGALVTKGLDSADAIQKMGVRTGATAEFLSGLKNAASQSDVEFDAVGRSITRLNRSIGEAADGTKAQEEAFSALGISMADLEGLNVDERFKLVADRLSQVKDEAAAARIGNDLFGRSFDDLRPLLADGAKGLEEFQKQAEATGQVLSQEQVDAAAKANDEMQKLQNTVSALGTQFAVQLAPQITEALGALQDALPALLDVADSVFTVIGRGFDAVGTTLGGLTAAGVQAFSGNFSGAGSIISSLVTDVGDIISGDDADSEADKQAPRQTDHLRNIDRNLQRGIPAVAG